MRSNAYFISSISITSNSGRTYFFGSKFIGSERTMELVFAHFANFVQILSRLSLSISARFLVILRQSKYVIMSCLFASSNYSSETTLIFLWCNLNTQSTLPFAKISFILSKFLRYRLAGWRSGKCSKRSVKSCTSISSLFVQISQNKSIRNDVNTLSIGVIWSASTYC